MAREVRLTVGPASWAVIFGCIVVALALRNVLVAGQRPIGWAVAAVVAASALEPLVAAVGRHVRRGVAMVLVVVPVLAVVGLVTWGVVDDLDTQVRRIKRDIPQVAEEIEESDRFGATARELDLVGKAEELADGIVPPSSRVGEEARGGATTWLLTLILTLFALGWGPRFADAALRQIPDAEQRDRLARIVARAFARSQVYVDAAVLLALLAGIVSWLAFHLLDLPAPTPLALLVGVASLVPALGVALAAVPAALLAGTLVSPGAGVAIGVGGLVLQVVHHVVLHRTTQGAAHPGAAVIVISFIVGYELYGVGGSVVGMSLAVFVSALLDSIAEEEAGTEPIEAPATTPG